MAILLAATEAQREIKRVETLRRKMHEIINDPRFMKPNRHTGWKKRNDIINFKNELILKHILQYINLIYYI